MKVTDQPVAGAFDDEIQIKAQAKADAQARLDREAAEGAKGGFGVTAKVAV